MAPIFCGALETLSRGLEVDRVRLGKNKCKTRISNRIKYWEVASKMRDEQEIEQHRIPAENHWMSEKLKNIYGP